MAITRQDYKYIHNTFGVGSDQQKTNKMQVGYCVTNLLAELSESNIYNPLFPEYYGVIEKPIESK